MKRSWGQCVGALLRRVWLLAPLCLLALLATKLPGAAQPLLKSAINVNAGNTKAVNQSFGYRLTYTCESSSGPCLNPEITDLLPADVEFLSTVPAAPTGDIAAINVTPNFGGSGRTRVQFVMVNPLTAGNSGDLVINVRFPTGTSPGTVASNTADAVNLGASPGTFTTSAVTVTALGVGTTTTVTSSLNPSLLGQSVTFTATVTGSGGTPTGSVTFKDGASTLGTVALNASGVATFTTSSLAVGSHTITGDYGGDSIFATSSGALAGGQLVNAATAGTALSSSLNPSQFGQAVTFTATVTGSGGTPTGTATFMDGAAVLGTVALNGAGVAILTTATLAAGTHSITAAYGGDGIFPASTSAALLQTVNVPPDSARLRALQLAVTRIEADGAGQIISGAINAAIADGFSNGSAPITPSEGGMRFNFTADLGDRQLEGKRAGTETRVGDAFASLGYAPASPSFKASPLPPQQKDWLAWGEIRGIGWNTNLQTGDIRGSQTHALVGVSRKFSPDLLVGLFGGYETFDYSSQLLNGRLKGDGWTVGGYMGWRLLPGLRLDAGVARSGIAYRGVAGTAAGSFPGERWLVTGGLTGLYRGKGFEIEPSARVYGLWEHEGSYLDSLGILQGERSFASGRASAGSKLTVPLAASGRVTVAPYAGLYADYYFSRDDATSLPSAPLLLPTEFIHGWSARITTGVGVTVSGGPTFALGGEVGGLGYGQFTNWSVRGRAAMPF